jgi:hypothetical protein
VARLEDRVRAAEVGEELHEPLDLARHLERIRVVARPRVAPQLRTDTRRRPRRARRRGVEARSTNRVLARIELNVASGSATSSS